MSLEASLSRTNELLALLLVALTPGAAAPDTAAPKAEPKAPAAKPATRGRVTSNDPILPPAPAASVTPTTPTPASTGEQAPSIPPYEEVAKAIVSLARKDQAAAEAILSKFEHKDEPGHKARNGKHLKPADYLACIAACAKASVA